MYAVSGEEYAELEAQCRVISARSKHYREAYNELKAVNVRLTAAAKRDKQEALAKQHEELMLLRAQVRARTEENAVLNAQAEAQARELSEARAALELFKSQVVAKDAVIANHEDMQGKLRKLNTAFMLEISRLNRQISEDPSVASDEPALISRLKQAEWQHGAYQAALKTLQTRVWELEGKRK